MKVSVSILKELNNYKDAIEKVNNSNADYLHLDIMDGSFTDNSSFKIDNFNNIEISKKLDVHLMSKNLDKLIDEYASLNPEIITFHYEVGSTLDYIKKIKEKNIKVGLAINPDTKISDIKDYLDKIDYLLIMSVFPGAGGQSFIETTVDKVKEVYDLKKNYNYIIGVDGGVDNNSITKIKKYVDIAVSGSYVTNSNNYLENIKKLKED